MPEIIYHVTVSQHTNFQKDLHNATHQLNHNNTPKVTQQYHLLPFHIQRIGKKNNACIANSVVSTKQTDE